MPTNSIAKSGEKWLWLAALVVIFATALLIRLYDLDDPPLDFHVPRQIHSAVLARGFYAETALEMPAGERSLAVAMGRSEKWIEPPLLEALVSQLYRLVRAPDLRIPRVLNSLIWLLGGLPLYRLARKWTNRGGAAVGLIFYLFLPYAVIASRAFQPDPLMVTLTLFSFWTVWSWMDRPGWATAALTGLLAGLTVLVKPVAAFWMAGGLAGLFLAGWGLRRAVKDGRVWLMAAMTALPTLAYTLYGMSAGFLGEQFALRFLPNMLATAAFWLNWAGMIEKTVSVAAFLLALAGLLLTTRDRGRGLLWGWLAGYVIYGIVFTYTIQSHDYYQEPLIPLAALGLAGLAGAAWNALQVVNRRSLAVIVVTGLLAAGSLWAIYQARNILKKADYRGQPELWAGLAQQMGGDSSTVIGLFDDYGGKLQYYGYLLPTMWASTGDLNLRGITDPGDIRETFLQAAAGKKYFVITDFDDFDKQAELKTLLETQYPVFAQGNDYLIYDLTKPATK